MFFARFLVVGFLLSLAGCAADRAHREGVNLFSEGKIEEGLAKLEEAMRDEPTIAKYRSSYALNKASAVNQLLQRAANERSAGRFDEAETIYKRVVAIDKGNDKAENGLQQITRDRIHKDGVVSARAAFKAGDVSRAQKLMAAADADDAVSDDLSDLKQEIREYLARQQFAEPQFKPNYDKPVNLEFRNASVASVLEGLARVTGVNFILDRDVRPDLRTTVFLKQVALEDAVEFILQTNKLEKKVLNKNTVLIYPNTPEKLKEYQELIIRSFYVARANAKDVQATLKSLLKLKDVVLDEKLNSVIVRDTPETMRLVERLIALQDIYEPEVMLEVEVMEVNRGRLLNLGVQFPNQLSLTPLSSGVAGALTLRDIKNLNDSRIGVGVPDTVLNFQRDTSDTNLLANPRIRAKNHQKAKILIGDKVPVITTTTTATGFSAESVQYLDVGLKLEVEPTIYLKDEVAMVVNLEVSSLAREIHGSSGSLTYQVGTRSASTTLQLHDGETQILAGLISDDERNSASKLPGLGDLPVLGRLFATQKDDSQKTEIVLAITPRIVRPLNRPDAAESEFWSGTDQTLRSKPTILPAVESVKAVSDSGQSTSQMPNAASGQPTRTDKPSALTNSDPTAVSFSWKAPTQVKVGDSFEIALSMKSNGGVKSLPLQIGYDVATLQLQEIKEGKFFKQENSQSSFSSNIDSSAGRALVTASRLGVEGLQGEESVVVLVFKALAATKTDIRLLAATPITVSQQTPVAVLPIPQSLVVGQ